MYCNPLILDAALDYIANNVTQVAVCSSEPTTYAEATATYKLALKTGLTSAAFTKAAGDVSGRKVTLAQQAGVTVDSSGTANFVAFCSGTTLLYVKSCTAQALTAGNTTTIPANKIELKAPALA